MTSLATVCDFLGVVAGLAAIVLVALFLVVAGTRKSSLAWINIHFSLVAAAIGAECLSNVYAPHLSSSPAQPSIRILVSVAILTCAILSIPLYRRVRRHPQYMKPNCRRQIVNWHTASVFLRHFWTKPLLPPMWPTVTIDLPMSIRAWAGLTTPHPRRW